MKKKRFSLNQIQRILNRVGARVKKFVPTRGNIDKKDWKMHRRRIKGVHITFENDVSLSVQWGAQNYCDEGYTSCEVMAYDDKENALCIPGFLEPQHFDKVIGHVEFESLVLIVKACAEMKEKIKKEYPDD